MQVFKGKNGFIEAFIKKYARKSTQHASVDIIYISVPRDRIVYTIHTLMICSYNDNTVCDNYCYIC